MRIQHAVHRSRKSEILYHNAGSPRRRSQSVVADVHPTEANKRDPRPALRAAGQLPVFSRVVHIAGRPRRKIHRRLVCAGERDVDVIRVLRRDVAVYAVSRSKRPMGPEHHVDESGPRCVLRRIRIELQLQCQQLLRQNVRRHRRIRRPYAVYTKLR